MNRDPQLATLERWAVVVAGAYLAGAGINVMTRGEMMYLNYVATRVPLSRRR